ncbi:MAG: P-loop NTPase [Ruminiclostridium sp.]
MSECTHNCETCGQSCSDRTAESLLAPQNQLSDVKKVIAVVSGKGGVGKSLVTSLMASASAKMGYKTAILDADVTGPSVPKVFGIKEKATGTNESIYPVKTKSGIEIMSVNLLLENDTDPVVWRGPVIAGVIKQFWTDVVWNDVDYMFVDMPPGTGDVPLTVFQSLPVSGIIVVTSPQELVSMIVEKAVKMADMMNVPVIGLVENMSYFKCDSCGKEHYIFGESHIEETAKKFGIENIARLPINPEFAAKADKGEIEDCSDMIKEFAEKLLK